MSYRELSTEEKNLIIKQVERLAGEKEYNQYLIDYADLMLREGLEQNYKNQRREFEYKKKSAVHNVMVADQTIAELRVQLVKGVLQKERLKGK